MVMHMAPKSDAPPARAVVGPVALGWRPMHPDGPNPIRAYAVTRIGYRRFARLRHPPRTGGPTVGPRRRPCQFRLPCPNVRVLTTPRLCPRCPVVAAAVLLYWRVEFSNVMLTPNVGLVLFFKS
jgi:hypothetical protein